jgi:hypothetical protein
MVASYVYLEDLLLAWWSCENSKQFKIMRNVSMVVELFRLHVLGAGASSKIIGGTGIFLWTRSTGHKILWAGIPQDFICHMDMFGAYVRCMLCLSLLCRNVPVSILRAKGLCVTGHKAVLIEGLLEPWMQGSDWWSLSPCSGLYSDRR